MNVVKVSHMAADRAREYRALRQVLGLFARAGVIPHAGDALGRTAANTARVLRDAVLAEIPAFSESGNPDVVPGLERHIDQHLDEIRRLFAGGEIGEFEFVTTHAHRRAEQRFPLEMTLHAYRCGHRILSRWLRDAAISLTTNSFEGATSAIADFAIEYTNVISTIAAAEYVARVRVLAEAEGDERIELLNILLSGYDESDGRVARLLKRAGYLEQRQSYCVVAAQSVIPSEMESPGRRQRIADALATAAASTSIRMLTGARNNVVIAILRDTRRQSGWTSQQKSISERVLPKLLLLGPAVLVGVSADQPSTSFLPKAFHEAKLALDLANAADRVVHFPDLRLRVLLIRRAGDYLQAALPGWVAEFIEADAKGRGVFIHTLQAIAEADMNVQHAARLLGKHPNTLYARLERIKELTRLDGRKYHDLSELLLAIECRAK
jgi:hypothetical protein